jgi:hypothetical protein
MSPQIGGFTGMCPAKAVLVLHTFSVACANRHVRGRAIPSGRYPVEGTLEPTGEHLVG